MIRKISLAFLALVVAVCAYGLWHYRPIAAAHSVLVKADLPPLIPLREFYANADARWRFNLSPDGTKLAWLESKWLKPALWMRPLDGEKENIFQTGDDEVRWYAWSADSRYLIYQADRDGWENDVLVSIDTTQTNAKPRSYDFGKKVKTRLVQVPEDGGSKIVIAHNRRDPERGNFDLYRLDLASGETETIIDGEKTWAWWHLTRKGKVWARTLQPTDADWQFQRKTETDWETVRTGGFEDQFSPLSPPGDDGYLYAFSNLGRDKTALVRTRFDTTEEAVIDSDPVVDYHSAAVDRKTGKPWAGFTIPGHQRVRFFDEERRALFDKLDFPTDATLGIWSQTIDQSRMLVGIEHARSGFETLMIDQRNGSVESISKAEIASFQDHLVDIEPVSIPSRDGLTIPAYLSRPKGVEGPAPMVIVIHGGPVWRTVGGWNGLTQWLSNRGYAVLDVNYRGSSGYGRAFREAAYKAVSRAMDDDITDARAWAIDKGYADPEKVAVFGGSFGGLKVLTAMTRNPDLYAAGIDVNGISDLVTMYDEVPPYWRNWPWWYKKYVGDVNDPEDRKEIVDRSPIGHADKLAAPLMIIQGANDVRVIRSQSDRMVEALRKHNKPVDYVLLEGAGHQFSSWGWKTRLRVYRRMERFLATHLGGRADGFDYAVLGADILPKGIGR